MDEWATPLVATALWTSRDGTMEGGNHESFLKGKGAPPTLNAPEALTRWDPWVRGNLAVTELTRYIDYVPTAPHTFTVSFRTAAGPSALVVMTRPDLPFFVAQLPLVQSWAELRDERALEILAQIDNQFAFIAAVTGLNVARKKWTMEWLTVTIQFTIAVELMFKHAFACYRPVEFSPQIQPIISTPGHSAYPMGHAAQAFATVTALTALLGINATHPTYIQLTRQARRISINRVVAGVHFPIDAPAGQMLGTTLGEFVACMSGLVSSSGVTCQQRTFAPSGTGDISDNDYLGDGPTKPLGSTIGPVVANIPTSPVLKKIAELARAEWDV
jgi:membrane-associated phospholipid phosphatase